MSNRYQESPVFETGSCSMKCKFSTPHILIGIGAAVLLLKLLPFLFLPLAFMGVGAYFLQQDKQPLDFREHGGKMTKGHVFVAIGAFLLISKIIPSSFIFPLALIAAGVYFLRKQK